MVQGNRGLTGRALASLAAALVMAMGMMAWGGVSASAKGLGDGGDVGVAAAAGDSSSNSGPTITEDITDPDNLLGADMTRITDAIAETKRTTGVRVKLLYLDSFNAGKSQKPEQWAGKVLESTDPDPNTVMLAVATADGNLVVVASSNSDHWLREQSTVDALSEAAAKPLATGGEQDWGQSALDMMTQLEREHQTAGSSPSPVVTALAVAVPVAALIAVGVVAARRRKARERRTAADGSADAGGEASSRDGGSPAQDEKPAHDGDGE